MAGIGQREFVRAADVHSRPKTWSRKSLRRLRNLSGATWEVVVHVSDVKGVRSAIWACGEDDAIQAASAMQDTRVGQWSCPSTGTTMAQIDTCAAGGRQRQGKWDKGGGRGAHKHQGCQSPTELVVGESIEIQVCYGSATWRFSSGERGRPSLSFRAFGTYLTGKVRSRRSVWRPLTGKTRVSSGRGGRGRGGAPRARGNASGFPSAGGAAIPSGPRPRPSRMTARICCVYSWYVVGKAVGI